MIIILILIILIISLVALGANRSATLDSLTIAWQGSIFMDANKYDPNYYDPKVSHVNKWKNGDKSQGEKFWLSSTLLVWTTDYMHKVKAQMIWSLISIIPVSMYLAYLVHLTDITPFWLLISLSCFIVTLFTTWFISFETTFRIQHNEL